MQTRQGTKGQCNSSDQNIRDTTCTRRRVKLYVLGEDDQWLDKGTGHVSTSFVEDLQGKMLIVRDESDGSLLLESKIEKDRPYERQRETLIVWTESDDVDLALSFQEMAGCDEIWKVISEVQEKDPAVNFTSYSLKLPPCEIGRLEEIAKVVVFYWNNPTWNEKLSSAIEECDYLKKLLVLFQKCEDGDNIEGLYCLSEIVKNIFLLNKTSLLERLLSEEFIFDVVGCLEYNPNFSSPLNFRENLRELSNFKVPIVIDNPELTAKILQTHRAQYIHDIVLSTLSQQDDNHVSALSNFIVQSRLDITAELLHNKSILSEVFAQLEKNTTNISVCRDLICFLKAFYDFTLPLISIRDEFYDVMFTLGIVPIIQTAIQAKDSYVKQAAIAILTTIVEYSPVFVRNYVLKQIESSEDTVLINVLTEYAVSDFEHGSCFSNILKIFLDKDSMTIQQTDLIRYFYKHSVHILVFPLLDRTRDGSPAKFDAQIAELLDHILDILSSFVEKHGTQVRNFIIRNNFLQHTLVLTKSSHTFLVVSAIKFMRKIIGMKDDTYVRYIIEEKLFEPVIDVFIKCRNNLLHSAILELFEFIKVEDIMLLCFHVVDNYGQLFDNIKYVRTFTGLKQKYVHYQKRLKERLSYWDQQEMESVWSDDNGGSCTSDEKDDCDNEDSSVGESLTTPARISICKKLFKENSSINDGSQDRENSAESIITDSSLASSILSPNRPTAIQNIQSVVSRKALVDYEGDSDEEDEDGVAAKRART